MEKSAILEDLEVELLLEAVFRHHGIELREYAASSLRRRIWKAIRAEKVATVSGFLERILHDSGCMERFILALTVNVTEMFRDPDFFLAFRREVVPHLKTYPFFRIWSAGCSSGEEVNSLAIMLKEEGLLHRCRIYATDLNETVLNQARKGIYPLKQVEAYGEDYRLAGGNGALSDYYTAAYDHVLFHPELRKNVCYARHNLATDASFNEFQAILCRNVLIYFQKTLQERCHSLFYDSLARFGFLCLGSAESLKFSAHEKDYEELREKEKIFRRVG